MLSHSYGHSKANLSHCVTHLVHSIWTTQQMHGQMSSGRNVGSYVMIIAFQQFQDFRTIIKRHPTNTLTDTASK